MDLSAATVIDDDQTILRAGQAESEPWRPIHYLGSKLRVLGVVQDAVDSVSRPGDPVCDLFAGSGTVSSWLARTRPVTAVDIQEYSRVICGALLNPEHLEVGFLEDQVASAMRESQLHGVLAAANPMIELEQKALTEAKEGAPENFAALIEAGSLMTAQTGDIVGPVADAMSTSWARLREMPKDKFISSMIFRHFGGVYFSYRQAAELDVALEIASRFSGPSKDILVAAVLATASDLVNTVGKQFAQPLRPRDKTGKVKRTLYSQAARDRYKSTSDTFLNALSKLTDNQVGMFNHKAVRSDFLEYISSSNFNEPVVYADPPYTRDHYSRFYHVLETIALRDDPAISTNTAHGRTAPSRGVYRLNRHQSPFCIRSKAPSAFASLFAGVSSKGASLVLSYSPYSSEKNAHPRVMTIDAIQEIAKSHFKSVDVESVGQFFHSRLNRTDLNKEVSFDAEYLFICR